MKRMFIVFIILFIIAPLSAIEQYAIARVNFTSELAANFGFTKQVINSSIKPADDFPKDTVVYFNEYDDYEAIRTEAFNIYWQLFTSQGVKLEVSGTPLTCEGQNGSITWSNSRNLELKSDGNFVLVYEDENNSGNGIRYDYESIRLVIDNDSLDGINWDEEYSGTLTLKLSIKG